MTPWIKVRTDLHEQREVILAARKLGLPALHVAGAFIRFWGWADGQTTDGDLPGVQPPDIDALVAIPGFAAAAQSAGWLVADDRGCIIPNHHRHNGESAKRRALATERKAAERLRKRHADVTETA